MPLTHPPIVLAAGRGDLNSVLQLLARRTDVDACARWTEEQQKWGYTKEWDWNADTALCVAVREGHVEVTRALSHIDARLALGPLTLHPGALLAAGADPHTSVCNTCDVHETPASIARSVKAKHPACAQLVLRVLFAEQCAKAEAACAKLRRCALPSLLELTAEELVLVTASEILNDTAAAAAARTHKTSDVLADARDAVVARVPQQLGRGIREEWALTDARREAAHAASRECYALGRLYLSGDGVSVDASAAVEWLDKSLRARPADDWDCSCYTRIDRSITLCCACSDRAAMRESLATLAVPQPKKGRLKRTFEWLTGHEPPPPVPSAAIEAAAAVLAADLRRGSAPRTVRVAELETKRRAVQAAKEVENEAKRERWAATMWEKYRAEDARYSAARAIEVARCARVLAEQGWRPDVKECKSDCCEEPDFCNYSHDYYHGDLPPHCRFFNAGACRAGGDCPFNHLERRRDVN